MELAQRREAIREKTERIDRILADTYGNPVWSPKLDPTGELILTILSQHTSDRNSGAAFDRLYDYCEGDWQRVLDADTEDVVEVIRSAGLANIKAPRIQAVLRELQDRTSGLDLDFLADMPVEESKAWLTSLDGVGPKTAACVLMFAFGLPVIPVDTHVHRVSRRIGIIAPKVGADAAHRELSELVPSERAYPFHVNLIRHGRRVCKAPVPLCHVCPLTQLCDYYQDNVAVHEHEEVLGRYEADDSG